MHLAVDDSGSDALDLGGSLSPGDAVVLDALPDGLEELSGNRAALDLIFKFELFTRDGLELDLRNGELT